jgi:hypothetical protein
MRFPHLQNNQSKMDWRYGSSVEYLPWIQTPVPQKKFLKILKKNSWILEYS